MLGYLNCMCRRYGGCEIGYFAEIESDRSEVFMRMITRLHNTILRRLSYVYT